MNTYPLKNSIGIGSYIYPMDRTILPLNNLLRTTCTKKTKCKVGVDIKKWLEKIILSHLGYELQSDNKKNQIMIREMSSSYLHSPCSTLPFIGRITSAIQGQCRQY